jgi:ribosomal protein S21
MGYKETRRHAGYPRKNNRYNKTKRLNLKSKRPSNCTVVLKENEPPERAIKRFLKKCKKLKIIEKYREKTDFYIKPSEKRRKKAIRRQRAIKRDLSENLSR